MRARATWGAWVAVLVVTLGSASGARAQEAPPSVETDAPPPPFSRRRDRIVSIEEKLRLLDELVERIAARSGERPPDVPATRRIAWEDAPVYEIDHYRITSNAEPSVVRVYAEALESLFAFMSRAFAFDQRLQRKCEVILYASREEFEWRERLSAGVDGFYDPEQRRVVCYHGRSGITGDTFTVLAHEAVHQFEHLSSPQVLDRAPDWVIEGLAVAFEPIGRALAEVAAGGGRAEDVRFGAIARDRLVQLQRAIRAGEALPLAELVRKDKPDMGWLEYAEAWGVVYWLITSERRTRQAFDRYWQLCVSGEATPEGLEQLLGAPLARLDERFRAWILALDPDAPPPAVPARDD